MDTVLKRRIGWFENGVPYAPVGLSLWNWSRSKIIYVQGRSPQSLTEDN